MGRLFVLVCVPDFRLISLPSELPAPVPPSLPALGHVPSHVPSEAEGEAEGLPKGAKPRDQQAGTKPASPAISFFSGPVSFASLGGRSITVAARIDRPAGGHPEPFGVAQGKLRDGLS